jgi:hypothetical protein
MLRTLLNPLRVTVTETTGTDRRTYRHRARDLADALEWAACYPRGTRVVIRSRLGRTLALRES